LRRKAERPFGLFLILNGFVPMLALAIGQSMVYDNDRLFIGAMPFIAALAAVGGVTVFEKLSPRLPARTRLAAAALLIAAAILPQLVSAGRLYPHLLSYYSELIGGVAGAEKMGLEVTYWCETYNEVLDYLNENAEPGDIVHIAPWSHDIMIYYQLQGQLRDDIMFTVPFPTTSLFGDDIEISTRPFTSADFIVFQNRGTTFGPEGFDSPLARWLALYEPDFVMAYGDVSLIEVYQR
jgi:hypothetical protein